MDKEFRYKEINIGVGELEGLNCYWYSYNYDKEKQDTLC